MPKRHRAQRHLSDEVQGEGSWVIVTQLTVEEMRAARKEGEKKDFDAFELGVTILKAHVREWNWVDDDGEVMPQPKDVPDTIETLTGDEVEFLSKCVQGSEEDAKN